MDIDSISKNQFLYAYGSYKIPAWVKFVFKYFSKETEKKNMKLNNSITWLLIILFLIGFFSTILNLSTTIVGIVTILFTAFLVMLVLVLLTAILHNNNRIKKICRLLKIKPDEYNVLSDKYLM